MAYPKCEGPIVIPTGGWSISVQEFTPNAGPVTVTVAAGTYYLNTTNGANSPLVTALKTALDGNATLTGTYTVSVDDGSNSSTGKVTISATGVTTFNITWTSTDLRGVLGFTGNISGALTYTGDNQATYLWLPSVPRARILAPEPTTTTYQLGLRRVDLTRATSPDGRSVRMVYNTTYHDSFEFDFLTANKVFQSQESVVNESFEKFYDDVIGGSGLQFRYHRDRSDDSVYWTQVIEDAEEFRAEPMAGSGDRGWRQGASSLWGIRYRMTQAVGE